MKFGHNLGRDQYALLDAWCRWKGAARAVPPPDGVKSGRLDRLGRPRGKKKKK